MDKSYWDLLPPEVQQLILNIERKRCYDEIRLKIQTALQFPTCTSDVYDSYVDFRHYDVRMYRCYTYSVKLPKWRFEWVIKYDENDDYEVVEHVFNAYNN